jgi:hypothetical protein
LLKKKKKKVGRLKELLGINYPAVFCIYKSFLNRSGHWMLMGYSSATISPTVPKLEGWKSKPCLPNLAI